MPISPIWLFVDFSRPRSAIWWFELAKSNLDLSIPVIFWCSSKVIGVNLTPNLLKLFEACPPSKFNHHQKKENVLHTLVWLNMWPNLLYLQILNITLQSRKLKLQYEFPLIFLIYNCIKCIDFVFNCLYLQNIFVNGYV